MNFALNYLNYKTENILLMGRDIGAIHSIFIASSHKYNMFKGLILISPFFNEKLINITHFQNINCPTLLIKERIENEEKSKDNKEDEIILLCRKINNEKEWLLKNKKISEKNSNISNEKDILFSHRRKFINYIREYMKSNNEDKNIYTLSRKSTNPETITDNNEMNFDYLDNQNDEKVHTNNNIKKNYMKEFKEEDDNINYNNEDY